MQTGLRVPCRVRQLTRRSREAAQAVYLFAAHFASPSFKRDNPPPGAPGDWPLRRALRRHERRLLRLLRLTRLHLLPGLFAELLQTVNLVMRRTAQRLARAIDAARSAVPRRRSCRAGGRSPALLSCTSWRAAGAARVLMPLRL